MELTDYLALYGALLSTVVAVWTILHSRSKIRVMLAYAIEGSDDNLQSGIGISIQNPSPHPVHITSVSFLYPWRPTTLWDSIVDCVKYRRIPRNVGWCYSSLDNYEVDAGCPVSIEPGKSHYIFVPEEKVEELLKGAISRRLKVSVQDELWRNKTSRAFEYR